MTIRAYAPASMGNVAAGFDVLGAAFAPIDGSLWGDIVEVELADTPSFACVGPFADRLPHNPADNLVLKVKTYFEDAWRKPLPPLRIVLHKLLPVSSGLGSSSASAVAAAVAFDAVVGAHLSRDILLQVAARAESDASGAVHLDNVAPCLLGGLQLCADGRAFALPWPKELLVAVASPQLELATRQARAVLPREVPLSLAIGHAANLAHLVHALHVRDLPSIRACLRDLIAEPHRASLVPGFRQAQAAALAAGAWGCSLSGAGPAVFAVAEPKDAAAVADALIAGFAAVGVPAIAKVCGIDTLGARVLP